MNFPIKIRYTDKDEVVVVEKQEDIQKNRPFVVEETTKWGRHYKK